MTEYVHGSLLADLGTAVGQRIKAARDMGGGGLSGSATVTAPECSLFHTQTVAALGVVPTNTITITLAAHDDEDENHELWLDPMILTARAGVDEITINAAFSAPTSGPLKLNWSAL